MAGHLLLDLPVIWHWYRLRLEYLIDVDGFMINLCYLNGIVRTPGF